MKYLISIYLLALLFITSCSDDKYSQRIATLEQRISAIEDKEKKQSENAGQRISQLRNCVTMDADSAYWSYVRLNGKPVASKPGTYSAPVYVFEQARKEKQQKIEECKLLYGR